MEQFHILADGVKKCIQDCSGPECCLFLSIYGYDVRLVFLGVEPPEIMKFNLGLFLKDTLPEWQETVYIGSTRLENLLDRSMKKEYHWPKKYYQNDDYHIRLPGDTKRIAVRYNRTSTTCILFEEGEGVPLSYLNKPFINEIQWWLWDRFLVMHAAALGMNGNGALITSPSGQGKSTLALAGLLCGMEYVSEDYILIRRDSTPAGYPVFRTGYLTASSMEMLKEYKDHILFYAAEKGKYLLDLSAFEDQFRTAMDLKMILYPHITEDKEPSIIKADTTKAFTASLASTVKQIKSRQNTGEAFLAHFRRLGSLPAYEMRLSPDVRRNALYLKQFLLEQDTR